MRTSLIRIEDIPEAGAVAVEAEIDGESHSLILTRRQGEVFAFLNVCPHAGRRLDWAPGRFLFDAGRLVCAAHGAVFEFDTGLCVGGPCRGAALAPVPIALRGEDVVVAAAG